VAITHLAQHSIVFEFINCGSVRLRNDEAALICIAKQTDQLTNYDLQTYLDRSVKESSLVNGEWRMGRVMCRDHMLSTKTSGLATMIHALSALR